MSRMLWRRRAETWDQEGSAKIGEVIDKVLARCGERPDGVAIDLGCGSGQVTLPLASRYSQVLAVDINEHAIAMLGARAAEEGLANIRPLTQPVELLDLEPASLDLVVSNYTLHHLRDADKKRLISRSYEWLRPGGRLVIGDMMLGRGTTRDDRAIIRKKLRTFVRQGLGGWWRIIKNAWRFSLRIQEKPLSPAAWRSIIQEAGFEQVTAERVISEAGVVSAMKAPAVSRDRRQHQRPTRSAVPA